MAELRPEEMTGFEPELDQETFLLERQPYPGKLPWETQYEEQPTEEEPGEELVSESVRLDEDLLRLLQEDLNRAQRRAVQREKLPPETPLPARSVAAGEGAEVLIDLRQFPPHPSTVPAEPLPEKTAVEAPLEVVSSEVLERKPKRKRIPLEAVLLLLVFLAGGMLWYWVSRGRVPHAPPSTPATSQQPSPAAEERQSPADVQTLQPPFRQVREIAPLEVTQALEERKLPLLQISQHSPITPTPPTTTKTPPSPTTATSHHPLLQHSPAPHASLPSAPLPLFMVQVYASTSRADAEEIAAHLRQQGLPNVTLTAVQIRGQTWWRVRFGPYPTRLQAEQAALQTGFANAWIVRLQ